MTPRIARRGRFGAPFFRHHRHHHHFPVRRAWARGWRAGFVPWYGPVFWPYAYVDIFYYPFWPDGYYDGYWAFLYDDFFDSVFWGEVGPPEAYAYGPAPRTSVGTRARVRPRATAAGIAELCKQPGAGITSWPFAEIASKVEPTDAQKDLLENLRDAANKAAATFKVSCPAGNAFPLTPPGRLQAMTARLSATLEAVDIVRPPLEAFYNALSDEQKARFNQLGPTKKVTSAEVQAALPADVAKSCKEAKPGLTSLPIEKIAALVKPSETQQADLDKLATAVGKAVSILQAACPDETPITPTGRLEAMQKRLKAMVEAANTVKPALASFYGSLSNEQKARFNQLGRRLAKAK